MYNVFDTFNQSMQIHEASRGKLKFIIVVFNNMRTLKYKAQLTIGFFAAVNQN